MLSCRTNAFATHDCQEHAHERQLFQVHCPNCGTHRTSKDLNLKKVSNFAKLKCQSCNETSIAKNWACSCGEKLRKCNVHSICEDVPRDAIRKRKRHADPRGSDAPPPKSRRPDFETAAIIECAQRRNISLPPYSKLAAKCPHLVKSVVTDQRAATG